MHPFSSDFENNLVREQSLADNMTTFRPYPFPGRLVEVAYPLTEQGRPLAPTQLREYSQLRRFDLPNCFHGRESALLVKEAFEDGESYVTLECNVQDEEEERCPFLINLTALLRNEDSNMEFCLYHRRSYSPYPLARKQISIYSDDDTYSDSSSSSSPSSCDAVMSSVDATSEPYPKHSVHSPDVEVHEPELVNYRNTSQ
ncbi:hypothetical protein CVT26_001245 [Gymnopilus dilepis]|uniref:Uncharacterized protein n=1 Tax=Gymnopilus dilepis TaxID=231916 RepID=A0A409Y265_9AGAR|nr:hypothetical protein CVT26_001245 [Gymnopilus dilepis]